MLFIILHCLLGGLLIYGLLFLVYRTKRTANSGKVRVLTASACIIGGLNMVLGVRYLIQFIIAPEGFSEHVTFSSQTAYWLFTCFANYFYLLAMPLSIGLMGIVILAKRQNKIKLRTCLFALPVNSIGVLTIAALSCMLYA